MMRSNMQGKRSKARPAVQLLLISGILSGIPRLVFSAVANPDGLLRAQGQSDGECRFARIIGLVAVRLCGY